MSYGTRVMMGVFVILLGAVVAGATEAASTEPATQCKPAKPGADASSEAPADKAAAKADTPAEPGKTVRVEAKPLKTELSLSGVFEAESMTPVSIDPEAWKNLRVEKAVAPGAVVTKGQPILWLQTKKLDEKIEDIEANQALSDVAMKQAEEELRLLVMTTPTRLTQGRRSARIAQEDFERWKETALPYRDQYLALDERGIHLRRESAKEELAQLKKMYEADELIEETEAMVLKRNEYYEARSAVDYEVQKKGHAYRIKLDKPRQKEQQDRKLRDAQFALAEGETMLPIKLKMKRLQVAKMKRDRQKAADNFADLQADRELMVVHAPADGVVYYGECVGGQWTTGGQMEKALVKNGQIGPRQVFMTIVEPGRLFVRAGVSEKDLYDLSAGKATRVTPTGYPKVKLGGKISAVMINPSLSAKYAIRISLDDIDQKVLPGMTCKAKVVTYDAPAALMVPAKAVFSAEDEEEQRHVFLRTADGETVKRPVKVGREKDDQIEILEGLAEGDAILLAKPEAKE